MGLLREVATGCGRDLVTGAVAGIATGSAAGVLAGSGAGVATGWGASVAARPAAVLEARSDGGGAAVGVRVGRGVRVRTGVRRGAVGLGWARPPAADPSWVLADGPASAGFTVGLACASVAAGRAESAGSPTAWLTRCTLTTGAPSSRRASSSTFASA